MLLGGTHVKRTLLMGTVVTTALMLAMPFVGGAGPSFLEPPAYAAETGLDLPPAASVADAIGDTHTELTSAERYALAVAMVTVTSELSPAATAAAASTSTAGTSTAVSTTGPVPADPRAASGIMADTEHSAQKPVPKPLPPVTPAGEASGTRERRAALAAQGLTCPGGGGGTAGTAPGTVSPKGVQGTTTADLVAFAQAFNDIRSDNCLPPVPLANFRYDACMEQRLFWIAEDPSTDPSSAWGHIGSKRSDGLPSVGCDGNLAGGFNNTSLTMATKWWLSSAHRLSLYKPSFVSSTSGVCIYFAMTHGGVPDEPAAFARAAARWGGC